MSEQLRADFEAATWAYYQRLKQGGWTSPEEGDSSAPESLFWRKENGQYGVLQIEAAWSGWQLCAEHYGIEPKDRTPRCACCGTTENLHSDAGSGGPYRCGSPDCMVF